MCARTAWENSMRDEYGDEGLQAKCRSVTNWASSGINYRSNFHPKTIRGISATERQWQVFLKWAAMGNMFGPPIRFQRLLLAAWRFQFGVGAGCSRRRSNPSNHRAGQEKTSRKGVEKQ